MGRKSQRIWPSLQSRSLWISGFCVGSKGGEGLVHELKAGCTYKRVLMTLMHTQMFINTERVGLVCKTNRNLLAQLMLHKLKNGETMIHTKKLDY